MRTITQIIRDEVKQVIIANNGVVKCADIANLHSKYRNISGVVTMVQNAISYFRFSPQQANFREKYNFNF